MAKAGVTKAPPTKPPHAAKKKRIETAETKDATNLMESKERALKFRASKIDALNAELASAQREAALISKGMQPNKIVETLSSLCESKAQALSTRYDVDTDLLSDNRKLKTYVTSLRQKLIDEEQRQIRWQQTTV